MNDEKLDRQAIDECFIRMHRLSGDFLAAGYTDEVFMAGVYLMGANILTFARIDKVNVEQFMQQTFDRISEVVERLEDERREDG